jgi:hypothetical protein
MPFAFPGRPRFAIVVHSRLFFPVRPNVQKALVSPRSNFGDRCRSKVVMRKTRDDRANILGVRIVRRREPEPAN